MSKAFPAIRATTTARMDQILVPDTVSSTTVEASDIQKVRYQTPFPLELAGSRKYDCNFVCEF